MSTIKSFFFLLAILLPSSVYSQVADPILVRINNDREISKSDFEYAYKKDLKNKSNSIDSFNIFLDSYIDFLLTVEEAKKQNLDKEEGFKKEYSTYIEELEKPYLTDSSSADNVTLNIHNKLKNNIEISHIFIKLHEDITLPKDTLEPYKRISYIKKELSKNNNNNFEELVLKYSEDSISLKSITPGYLGWRTALSEHINFEEMMYNTPIGETSNPVRTDIGYHIIMVHNKRPDPGQFNLAHIAVGYTPATKDTIAYLMNEMHKELLAGADFEEFANRYSQDRESGAKGGKLGWFGVNKPLRPDLEEKVFALKEPGELTDPIETEYGFHIFKLLGKQPLLPWEKMDESLTKSIEKSNRNRLLIDDRIERLSKNHSYKTNLINYNKMKNVANKYSLTDTVFFKKIVPLEGNILLEIDNSKYTTADFISYMEENPETDYQISSDILKYKFDEFILDKLIHAEKESLFAKHPEFRHLAEEFHDGILYFNIMNRNIWEKAQNSRTELETIFNSNPDKYAFDSPKYKGYVIHTKDKETMDKVKSIVNNNKNQKDLRYVLPQTLDEETMKSVIIEKGLWKKGQNPYVDRILYKIDNKDEIIGYPEFIIEGKLIESPENLDDVYGEVTADYQEILEQEWKRNLREKYKVEINEEVLESIKQLQHE